MTEKILLNVDVKALSLPTFFLITSTVSAAASLATKLITVVQIYSYTNGKWENDVSIVFRSHWFICVPHPSQAKRVKILGVKLESLAGCKKALGSPCCIGNRSLYKLYLKKL